MLQFHVPARSVPLLFCDLNDHLGVQLSSEKQRIHSDSQGEAVGSVKREKEGYGSTFFRELAVRHKLCFVNIFV